MGMPATSTRLPTPDRHQHLPRGSAKVARTTVVSWLRAAALTFPVCDQWCYECALVLVTVAGPHRHRTGFRGSRPRSIVKRNYRRRSARASATTIAPPSTSVSTTR